MAPTYEHVFCVTNDITYDRRIIRHANLLSEFGSVLIIGRKIKISYEDTGNSIRFIRLKCIFNRGALFYAEFNFRLFLFLLLHVKFSNLTCVDLDTVMAGYIVSKIKSVRTFFDANEYFTEVPELIDKPLVKRIWTAIGKITLPSFDQAYTVNESLKEVLSQKYNCNFSTIKNVPTSRQNLSSVSKKRMFTVVYLGMLNPGRGLELLVDYAADHNEIKLLIIGDGPLNDSLKTIAINSPNVIFTGLLNDNEISDRLQTCHVGINLLEETSESYRLSLANKFFDYIHHGLPVITMKFPEYELINSQFDCCLLLHHLDKESIREAVNSLMDNEIYKRKSEQAIKARKIFNWDTEKRNLHKIYGL